MAGDPFGGPSPDYLAQIHQTLTGAPPTGPIMLGGRPPPPAVPTIGPPAPAAPVPPDPGMSMMPPAGMSMAPPPPPRPPAPAAPPPRPNPFPLVPIGGGGVVNVPAMETEMRGPTLRGAQQERNAAMAGAVDAVRQRNEQMGAADFALALEQERKANIREDAANYSAAEREEELAQRQADFDTSVKALSAQHIDPNRFWAGGETTAGKIGAAVKMLASLGAVAMGGYVAGKTGRPNDALNIIQTAIDRDIKAQEFTFMAQRDAVNAKQTAFAMAMQKYNNVDAARAAARAAGLDAAQAQIAQSQALWKTADAQNRATMAIAALQDEKMQQIAQGIMFSPARQVATGRMFLDPSTGLTYNEAQAREVAKETRGQEHAKDLVGLNVAGDLMKEGAKADVAAQKSERGLMVQLPNGDVVKAPDEKEAGKLRETAVAVHNVNRIINQAREIRSQTGWRADPRAVKRLEQLQAEGTIAAKEIGNLGVLAGPDLELTNNMVGNMTSVMPGVDNQLAQFAATASAALRNRVKTYADAPGTAKGEMPSSFTPYGKK